jgi:hypothetical protein
MNEIEIKDIPLILNVPKVEMVEFITHEFPCVHVSALISNSKSIFWRKS